MDSLNPQWIIAGLSALGIISNAAWTLVNLRIENKLLKHIDGLKDWVDARYERRPNVQPHRAAAAKR
jgi:hypothetical protein